MNIPATQAKELTEIIMTVCSKTMTTLTGLRKATPFTPTSFDKTGGCLIDLPTETYNELYIHTYKSIRGFAFSGNNPSTILPEESPAILLHAGGGPSKAFTVAELAALVGARKTIAIIGHPEELGKGIGETLGKLPSLLSIEPRPISYKGTDKPNKGRERRYKYHQ